MNRTEFIQTLRDQLAGQMQEGRVAAHIRYYEDYIHSQIRSGRTEEEVLTELGDPRLIAKTLIDTNPDCVNEIYEDSQESYYNGYSDTEDTTQPKMKVRHFDLSTWYGKVVVILCAVLAVIVLLALIGTVLPFFIILVIILYLLSWWKKRH